MTKPPSPQAVSALLKRAGFERSASRASRIKGWRWQTPGYVVHGPDHRLGVRVYYQHGNNCITDEIRQQCTAMKERYAQAIENAGWTVERNGGPWTDSPIIVTAGETRSEEKNR